VVLSVIVTVLTGNPNLIPTIVLLGSFLVPVTFVSWAFERRDTGELTPGLLFTTFVTGGVLAQVRLFPIIEYAGFAVVSLIGVAWLVTIGGAAADPRTDPPELAGAFRCGRS
jgi:hypothetical protein